ncbi:MAG TPA: hypothetical protein VH639_05580 [Bryobacteraceae bacterium]|jgi:hypothetical protein
MQEPESGVIQVHAVVANDGRLVVVLEFPDGHQRLLDRDAAVAFSLTVLNAAGRLFPTAAEFSRTIDQVRGVIEPMRAAPGIQ